VVGVGSESSVPPRRPAERGRQRRGADGPLLGRLKRAGSQAPADLSRLLHALQYAGHF
jgi:hypothetical protein